MEKLLCYVFVILLFACNGTATETVNNVDEKTEKTLTENDHPPNKYQSLAPGNKPMKQPTLANKTSMTNPYADQILSGKILPTDNERTFEIMDSLEAKSEVDRKYYFKVFLKIVDHADGALGEAVGQYAYSYVEHYPVEFFEHSKTMTKEQFTKWAEYVGFEIVASSEEDPLADAEAYCNKIKQAFPAEQLKPVHIYCAVINKFIISQNN